MKRNMILITSIVAMMIALGMSSCNNAKTEEKEFQSVFEEKKDELPPVTLTGDYFPAIIQWIAVKKNFRSTGGYYLAKIKNGDLLYEYSYGETNWRTGDTSFELTILKHTKVNKVPFDSFVSHGTIYKDKFFIGKDDSTNRKLINSGVWNVIYEVARH